MNWDTAVFDEVHQVWTTPARQVSQSAIARHLGLTRSQVSLWVRGKQSPSKRYAAALRAFLASAEDTNG